MPRRSAVGIRQPAAPMFAPCVKWKSWSSSASFPCACASCVKPGSRSMYAFRRTRRSSSGQRTAPAMLMSRSADFASSSSVSRDMPKIGAPSSQTSAAVRPGQSCPRLARSRRRFTDVLGRSAVDQSRRRTASSRRGRRGRPEKPSQAESEHPAEANPWTAAVERALGNSPAYEDDGLPVHCGFNLRRRR